MIPSLVVYCHRMDVTEREDNRSEAISEITHLSNQDVKGQPVGTGADEPSSKKCRTLTPKENTVALSDVLQKELHWKLAPQPTLQSPPSSESSSSVTSTDSSPTTSSDSYQIDALETTVRWSDCCHVVFRAVFD